MSDVVSSLRGHGMLRAVSALFNGHARPFPSGERQPLDSQERQGVDQCLGVKRSTLHSGASLSTRPTRDHTMSRDAIPEFLSRYNIALR